MYRYVCTRKLRINVSIQLPRLSIVLIFFHREIIVELFMMIRLSRSLQRYLCIAFVIYLTTILLSFMIYFLLILVEKHFPWVNLCIYITGGVILNGLNLFSKHFRYFLPNLSDDEYYLLLINTIISIFALIYSYLFCK